MPELTMGSKLHIFTIESYKLMNGSDENSKSKNMFAPQNVHNWKIEKLTLKKKEKKS